MVANWMNLAEKTGSTLSLDTAIQAGGLASSVLSLRGVSETEQSEILSEAIPELADPFQLKDMDLAVDCLLDLLPKRAKIVVHGDYDTDGVTATAILVRILRKLGFIVFPYIPKRLTDGYGLSDGGVRFAKMMRADLLLTCDCGVQSFRETDELNSCGIRVIVTDHHSCLAQLPDADAVVNPNRHDDRSSNKDLAGAGVAMKLVQGLGLRLGETGLWESVVDLAALGTVGDSMRLVGENRSIVRYGLAKLRQDACVGLTALMESVKIDPKHCVASDLAFKLSPKINAAGRLGDSTAALELLLADLPDEAAELSAELLEQNNRRKEIEGAALEEAYEQLGRHPEWLEHQGVVIAIRKGHAGVMGIVAQRLSDYLAVPVVALVLETEADAKQHYWRGSARSFASISVLSLIDAAAAHVREYGGHPAAAGLSVETDQLAAFRLLFQAAADHIDKDELNRNDRCYECELPVDTITLDQALELEKLEPFGEGNPEPFFLVRDLELAEQRIIGKDARHLRMKLKLGGDQLVSAVCFNAASRLNQTLDRANFVFRLRINYYRGREELSLLIEDYFPLESEQTLAEKETCLERETLYQRFTDWSGSELAAILGMEAGQLAPDSLLLANTYRILSSKNGTVPARYNISDLTHEIKRLYNINCNEFHIRRAIDMYQEAGLIAVRRINHHAYLIAPMPVTEKVDLYNTPTWKRLQLNQ